MRALLIPAVVLAVVGCAGARSGDGDPIVADAPVDARDCSDLPCEAIYVAPAGSDSGAGTKESPLRTIGAGIVRASLGGVPKAVFVRAGMYTETIVMSPGVSVYGGFDEAWKRNPAVTTELVGSAPVVLFDSITVPTALDRLTVRSHDAMGPGASSYAVVVKASRDVELRDVTIEAGAGAPGTDGFDGAAGAPDGADGIGGQPGCENSGGFCASCSRPQGGEGGYSFCGRTGGRGGNAGHSSNGGSPGAGGIGGSAGGAGAPGESANGYPGAFGVGGSAGLPGSGGASMGVFSDGVYNPAHGSDGASGGDGAGGGGGGGGGGGTTDCDSFGSSGGGGGGGGCGGGGGTAGTGGGGSFGVIAFDSSVVVRSSMVVTSQGGVGGRGGRGGLGTAGGAGGEGGPDGGDSEQDDGGFGARGGGGGDGGNGGHGGGGGGGPSAPLVCVGSATITIPQSTLVPGLGGFGGTSLGISGARGTSSNALGCTFF
jgi:hypothetical protein